MATFTEELVFGEYAYGTMTDAGSVYKTLLLNSGPTPTLGLDFTTDTIDPLLTFTRTSTGTRFNSSGAMESVVSGSPRFDYDPNTLAPLGLLMEPQRTNLLLNSLLNGTPLSTQSVTVTAAAHTLSFYGTGTVTLSGASTAGPLVGTGALNLVSLTFTPTAGSLTVTVSGTVKWANLELGGDLSSFIPTAGATATRIADSLSATGANFSSWYNQSAGAFVFHGSKRGASLNGQNMVVVSDGTNNERFTLYFATNTNRLLAVDGGVTQATLDSGTTTAAETFKIGFGYAANDFASVKNGGTVVTDLVGTVPTPSSLGIATGAASGTSFNGHVRSLKYYNTRLSNSTLQGLTV